MARVWTEGHEFGDLLFFDVQTGGTVITNPVRSGTYAVQNTGVLSKNLASNLSEFYLRVAVRSPGLPSGANMLQARNSTNIIGQITVNASTRKFEIRVGSTVVASSTVTMQSNTWYLLEWYLKIADAGGVSTLKVDGVQEATFSGDTKPGADTNIDQIYSAGTGGGNHVIFDDWALNDTTGGVDNSWPGDGRVLLLMPNNNGDVTQLNGSDGDQVNNYLLVQERPPDGDTTYVFSSTVDNRDLYNLVDSGLSGVTIHRVWAEARARDTVAAGGTIALVVKTNGNEYDSSDISLLTSYTKQLLGTVHRLNPQSGSAWTTGELDALQVGPKVRSA